MTRLLTAAAKASLAAFAVASIAAAQTPSATPTATPGTQTATPGTQTPAATATAPTGTATPAATPGTGTSTPQAAGTSTPPAPAADTMIVTALVPVPPGTVVRLEVLDVSTLRGVPCGQATSVADAAAAGNVSRVTFAIVRAVCVAPYSGILRMCWADNACAGFEFAPGKTVDLGLFPRPPVVPMPPNVGGGMQARGGSVRTRRLLVAATGMLALGVLGLAVAVETLRRKKCR